MVLFSSFDSASCQVENFDLGQKCICFHTYCGVEKITIRNDISGPHKKCQTGGNFIHGNVLLLWHTVDVGGLINRDLHQFPLATNRLMASRTLDNNVPFKSEDAINRLDAIRGPAINRPDAGNVLWEGTEYCSK